MRLALFDFDGTISFKDSFIGFLRFGAGQRFWLYFASILPQFLAYKCGILSQHKIKNITLSKVFKGLSKAEFNELCAEFSLTLEDTLRKGALERLAWHKANNDKIVIVSASLEEYLRPWCDKMGFELIASRVQVRDGRMSGCLDGFNCNGDEKVRRIRQKYDLSAFERIFAYGDSKGDLAMLSLAHERFYKPFRG